MHHATARMVQVRVRSTRTPISYDVRACMERQGHSPYSKP